ncbi:MAG: DUF389 domain-containing protein [Gemmatimonadaceae bacterium]|nr:DUF389 domain-containing protein [Gemmatimonadaceae bacterium]
MNTLSILRRARSALSLRDETDYDASIAQVRADVELRSGGAWALVFAIFIASVGLNVNSTAVIIGAMLISPLMGPIVGTGVALATSDVQLLRRSIRSLLIATGIALATSTLFFFLSPLAEAQSELLSRTRPTLYDVLIALFGGAAGIVAVTRKANKSQVVPGVAIATALMPPLCTAGFGLAHGDLWFFLGAMNLFLINALFICLATLGFVRLLRFPQVAVPESTSRARVNAVIIALTLILVVPSVYTGWNVVQETRFKGASRRFVAENLVFTDRSVLNTEFRYSRDSSTIEATLIGEPLPTTMVDSIQRRLPSYGLPKTRLVLRQPLGRQPSLEELADLLRQGALKDLTTRNARSPSADAQRAAELQAEVLRLRASEFPSRSLFSELRALNPGLVSIAVGRVVTEGDTATVLSRSQPVGLVATWRRAPDSREAARLRNFLATRLGVDSVELTNIQRR